MSDEDLIQKLREMERMEVQPDAEVMGRAAARIQELIESDQESEERGDVREVVEIYRYIARCGEPKEHAPLLTLAVVFQKTSQQLEAICGELLALKGVLEADV